MDCRWTFLSADVELTNICTEQCAMCPRDGLRRPQGCMTEHVFSRLLEVLVQFKSRVTFSGFGNPTLHPQWAKWISMVRAAGLPAGLVLHSGSLSPEVLRLLAEHPPSHLEISFPSVEPHTFSRLCPRTDFDEAMQRVLHLHRQHVAPLVCVGLETSGCSPSARQYREFWKPHGIATRLFPCHSRGGNLRDPSLVAARPAQARSCGLLALHAFVTWQGDLLACCHDLTGETHLGNLSEDDPLTLAERKALAANNPPWQLCRACDEFRRDWPLPTGDCPRDPALRARQLRRATRSKRR